MNSNSKDITDRSEPTAHQDPTEERHPVEILADDFARRLRDGESPSIGEYTSKHPELADLIQSIFPPIALVERVSINEAQQRKAKSNPSIPSRTSLVPDALGDYQLVREIGRGGMGIVYEAVQQSLNRHVALKVINSVVSGNSQHRARFRREAESAASLHHTNIVPIYGIGEDHEIQYYAMQLIDGVTLSDVIECLRRSPTQLFDQSASQINDHSGTNLSGASNLRTKLQFGTAQAAQLMLRRSWTAPISDSSQPPQSGNAVANQTYPNAHPATIQDVASDATGTMRLSDEPFQVALPSNKESAATIVPRLSRDYFRNVARAIANVANAMDYAHRQHVLHRDIKPANLLLDRDGTVWITDFGLARRTDLDGATQTGEILGTLRYMAPEQIAGRGDNRIDIYSLGLTLFELLTLRPAIDSPKLRLLDPVRNSTIPRLRSINPGIPSDLETITLKACAYSPEHRYQTAGEFEADLRRFLEDRPILARKTSRLEALLRWARRNPAIASLASFALFMLLCVAGLLAVWNRQQQRSLVEISSQFDRAETNLREKSEALESVRREQTRAETNLELAIRAFDKIADNIAARGSTLSSNSDFDTEESIELSGTTLSVADVALLESLLEFFDQFSRENEKDLRLETADARKRVGDIQNKIGKLEEAEQSYLKALSSFTNLSNQFPDKHEFILSQVAIYNELISVTAKRGQIARTLQYFQEARKLLDTTKRMAESADSRFALAKLLNSVGTLAAKFGREPRLRPPGPFGRFGNMGAGLQAGPPQVLKREAELNAEALDLLNTLVNEDPEKTAYKIALARALRDEARIAKSMAELPRADEALNKSVQILESLIKANPDSIVFKYELADTLSTTVAMRPIDMQRALRSLAMCDEILATSPFVPEYLALKASTLVRTSMMMQATSGRTTRSEEALQEALKIQRELAKRYSDVAVYTISLSQTLSQLAELQASNKKLDKAIEHLSEAIQLMESLQRQTRGPMMLKPFVDRMRKHKMEIEARRRDLKE
jgi:serine/threonine protein kinase